MLRTDLPPRLLWTAPGRTGISLIEVVMATALAALLAASLAGLAASTQQASDQASRIEAACLQHRVLQSRLSRAVARCGTYALPGQPTEFGLRVVRVDGEALGPAAAVVCWTGGRDSDRSRQPPQTTLPLASELIVFAPDPDDAARFGEVCFPAAVGTIDFDADDLTFRTKVNELLRSPQAEFAPLCGAVTHSSDTGATGGYGGYGGSDPAAARRHYGRLAFQTSGDPAFAAQMTAVSCELRKTPADAAIAAARISPIESDWDDLPWYRGNSTATTGQQHLWLAFEIQYDATSKATTPSTYPLFGAVERTVTHERF